MVPRSLIIGFCVLAVEMLAMFAAHGAPSAVAWDNPEFQARFLGSYGFDGPREPSVTVEEQRLLEVLVPLMEQGQTAEAARRLREGIAPGASPAMPYTLGNLYFQSGDLDSAETAYRRALAGMPSFVRAARNLGLLLAQQGRYDEAATRLGEAVSRGDDSAAAWGTLAFCHYQNGDPTAALVGYERAAFLEPASADWQVGRAQALLQLDRAPEALAVATRFLERQPHDREARLAAVNAALVLDDWEEAAVQLETLRRQDLADADALALLGRAYLTLGIPGRATEAYVEALRLPRKPPAKDLLAATDQLARLGRADEAGALLAVIRRQYAEALPAGCAADLALLEARLLLDEGQAEAAAERLRTASAENPLREDVLLLLARAEHERGEPVAARIALEQATRVDGAGPEAWVELGRLHVEAGRWPEAVAALRQAQSIHPQANVARYLESVERAERADGRVVTD